MSDELFILMSDFQVVFLKSVLFILGYLTIRLGYNLFFAGAKGEFKFSANLVGLKANLASFSPGLLFLLLGIILMGSTMYIDKGTELTTENAIKNNKLNQHEISKIIPSMPIQAVKKLIIDDDISKSPEKLKELEDKLKIAELYFNKGIEAFYKMDWKSAIVAFGTSNDIVYNDFTSYNLACSFWNAEAFKSALSSANDIDMKVLQEPYRAEAIKIKILGKMETEERYEKKKIIKTKKAPK
jgi:hypothetical protein